MKMFCFFWYARINIKIFPLQIVLAAHTYILAHKYTISIKRDIHKYIFSHKMYCLDVYNANCDIQSMNLFLVV